MLGSDIEWFFVSGGSLGTPDRESPRPPAPEAGLDPVLDVGLLTINPEPLAPIIMEPGLDIMSPYLVINEQLI